MKVLVWLLGRGASIACGLGWTEPEAWRTLDRVTRQIRIREALLAEMSQPGVDTRPYKQLLAELAHRTVPGWEHLFLTTNWDRLLQREIDALGLTRAPPWMPETHVFHLNGAVENLPESDGIRRRVPILLETDTAADRISSVEFERAVQFIQWRKHFVVVGMSFACPTDQAFLCLLHRYHDSHPMGFSRWLVVNREAESAQKVAELIQSALPNAQVESRATLFEDWIKEGMPPLVAWEILEPEP
jgi:hypothetical protein